jgi:hypothetical protein
MEILKTISALCAFSLLLNTAGICAMDEAAEKSAATIVKEFVTEEATRIWNFSRAIVVPVITARAVSTAIHKTYEAAENLPIYPAPLRDCIRLAGTVYAGYLTNRLCIMTCHLLGIEIDQHRNNAIVCTILGLAFLYQLK